jgi:hypothetical protein
MWQAASEPPTGQTFEPPIQALSSFVMQEVDDMKATGASSMPRWAIRAMRRAAKAILARKDQSNLTTMHYIDNLGRSFKQGGDIIAEVVPKIYDTEREIEILGEDEKQKSSRSTRNTKTRTASRSTTRSKTPK